SALKPIDTSKRTANADEVVFELRKETVNPVKFVDADGKELAGPVLVQLAEYGRWHHQEDGRYNLESDTATPIRIGAFHPERKLAAFQLIKKISPEPLRVMLRPTGGARGRLVDEDGKPMGQIPVTGPDIPDQRHTLQREFLTTDGDGR